MTEPCRIWWPGPQPCSSLPKGVQLFSFYLPHCLTVVLSTVLLPPQATLWYQPFCPLFHDDSSSAQSLTAIQGIREFCLTHLQPKEAESRHTYAPSQQGLEYPWEDAVLPSGIFPPKSWEKEPDKAISLKDIGRYEDIDLIWRYWYTLSSRDRTL